MEIKASDVLATPLARRVAQCKSVDLAYVSGSGHGGKITKADVLATIPTGDEMRVQLKGMRKVIACRMSKSAQECPTVTQNMKVDVTKLLKLRTQININRENKITINDFILKIVANAVAQNSFARTQIDKEELVIKQYTNIGFAVGMEDGLLVPVIKNADKLSLSEISAQSKALAKKAREGTITQDELSGGVFTVSNMGMYDVLSFSPIINQPEGAILGVCAISDELALTEGQVTVKKVMIISLAFDHRVMNGTEAAKLQLCMKQLIENPLEALC